MHSALRRISTAAGSIVIVVSAFVGGSPFAVSCFGQIQTPVAPAAAAESTATAPSGSAPSAEARPQIEVCFVLDTTGSMGGLIAGAKTKIWSIANQIVSAKPTPRVRFGLVAYRDVGDQYVTRVHDLSDDLDTVYAELQTFQAIGGGDGPESVNQAMHEALTRMTWATDDKVLRIIFLVGDAPPHMDYPNDTQFPVTCEAAARRGIVINTIQCGVQKDTEKFWRDIARRAEGRYTAIGQTGDVEIVQTPMDAELAKLNVEIGKTLVPYGSAAIRESVVAKQARSEEAPAGTSADRLGVLARAGRGAVMTDGEAAGGDLVDDLNSGRRKLADLKDEEFPEDLRALPADQRAARIEELRLQREKIQAKINLQLRERDAYITKELAARAKADGKDGFDQIVSAILAEQAVRKGIHLKKNP